MSKLQDRSAPNRGLTALLCLVLGCLSLAPGCLSDSNRCAPGLVLDRDNYACIMAAAAAGGEPSTPATGGEPSTAGSGSEPEGGAGNQASGLGASCASDEECTGPDATFCLKNPLMPSEPGTCTIIGCSPGTCGADYTCCDCSALGAQSPFPEPGCIADVDLPRIEAYCDCK